MDSDAQMLWLDAADLTPDGSMESIGTPGKTPIRSLWSSLFWILKDRETTPRPFFLILVWPLVLARHHYVSHEQARLSSVSLIFTSLRDWSCTHHGHPSVLDVNALVLTVGLGSKASRRPHMRSPHLPY